MGTQNPCTISVKLQGLKQPLWPAVGWEGITRISPPSPSPSPPLLDDGNLGAPHWQACSPGLTGQEFQLGNAGCLAMYKAPDMASAARMRATSTLSKH